MKLLKGLNAGTTVLPLNSVAKKKFKKIKYFSIYLKSLTFVNLQIGTEKMDLACFQLCCGPLKTTQQYERQQTALTRNYCNIQEVIYTD